MIHRRLRQRFGAFREDLRHLAGDETTKDGRTTHQSTVSSACGAAFVIGQVGDSSSSGVGCLSDIAIAITIIVGELLYSTPRRIDKQTVKLFRGHCQRLHLLAHYIRTIAAALGWKRRSLTIICTAHVCLSITYRRECLLRLRANGEKPSKTRGSVAEVAQHDPVIWRAAWLIHRPILGPSNLRDRNRRELNNSHITLYILVDRPKVLESSDRRFTIKPADDCFSVLSDIDIKKA